MKKQISAVLITLFLIFAATAAHAALVTESFTGTITFADATTPFGVDVNDTFAWTTTYDLDFQNALGNVVIGEDPNMKLSVTIGSRTFVETEDKFYGSGDFGAPILTFDDQNHVNGVSFLVDDLVNNYRFSSNEANFTIYSIGDDGMTSDLHLVSGTFDFNPVPVPGAVWLLGGGLLGLVGLRRRRNA
jgi:hypothetical protein